MSDTQYAVCDYRTGELLDVGVPSARVIAESLATESGAVRAYLWGGTWEYLPESGSAPRGCDTRTVFVCETT